MEIRGTSCCGISELVNIGYNSPEQVLANVKSWAAPGGGGGNRAHLYFSSVTREKYGEALEAFILEHNLGSVVSTPSKRNPNSGNAIKGWFWTPNWPNVRKLKTGVKSNLAARGW